MFRCPKTEGDDYYKGVDHETDKNSRSDNFRIGIFLFIEVPCATNSQESSIITHSVENEDDDIENLQIYIQCQEDDKTQTCRSSWPSHTLKMEAEKLSETSAGVYLST